MMGVCIRYVFGLLGARYVACWTSGAEVWWHSKNLARCRKVFGGGGKHAACAVLCVYSSALGSVLYQMRSITFLSCLYKHVLVFCMPLLQAAAGLYIYADKDLNASIFPSLLCLLVGMLNYGDTAGKGRVRCC
jgi:hypothetical protein